MCEEGVCVCLFIWIWRVLEGEKSGAKSAVKRDLNTIVPCEWECFWVQNY